MSLSTKLKKDELRTIAEELGLIVPEEIKVLGLRELIEKSEVFNSQPEVVQGIVEQVIADTKENREREKIENETKLELERLKLAQIEKEIELANVRKDASNLSQSSEVLDPNLPVVELESLIKSIKTLTIPVPRKTESFNLFFHSIEKAFQNKSVPDELRAEILLNILGEKVNNLLVYVEEKDLGDYDKIKTLVLKEFEPTPQECLNNFKGAQKLPSENYVQFASRLSASFDYYCQLRKVNDFKSLCELIVSDKIFETLDRELMTHISVKQGETYFKPQQLGRECDIYLSSKCKGKSESTKAVGGETKRFVGNKFKKTQNSYDRNISKVFVSELKGSKCILCKNSENHALHLCPQFKQLSVWERSDVVRRNKLCFRCFLPHKLRECRSERNCFCGQPHNRMIHYPREEKGNSGSQTVSAQPSLPIQVEKTENGRESSIVATSVDKNRARNVLLSTVRAFVKNKFSEYVEVRCLLDVGSQSCLCTKACAEKLQLRMERINTVVSGVNDATMVVCNSVNTTIANKDRTFERNLSMLVVDKITDLIPNKLIQVIVDVSEFVQLADQSFNIPGNIDMLLGAEIFYELLRPGQIYAMGSQLLLQNTVFGYVASGSVADTNESKVYCGFIKEDIDLDKTLKRFWEIEAVEPIHPRNKEAEICEEHYARTHTRDKDGRYIVAMPLKEEPTCLGNSRDVAEKRLNSLYQRFVRDPEYFSLYKDFLREYEALAHMCEVSETEEPSTVYYMPHHGIYRPQKSTTKLRTVFNASSITSNGNSLNSLQYNGGIIQDDLFSIMLRFRKHLVAFTADIRMMYRMIKIHPSQRSLQRILWKWDIDEPVKKYELCTVTYGTVSAPNLAMRTLKQIALDEGKRFPLAAPVLQSDFYMDDVLTGAQSLEQAKELQNQLVQILDSAGMTLHKWCCSNAELGVIDNSYPFSNAEETTALGVSWKSKEDCFSFQVKMEDSAIVSKRYVLSTIARLFDPLGLLGPIITKAKIFLQRLWQLKLNWDDELPEKETKEWQQFYNEMKMTVPTMKIDRCIVAQEALYVELHGFSDASEMAYGAIVYAKSITASGDVTVKLITSKSRVAPIKQISIPRLELCGALLVAKLMEKVKAALMLDISSVHFWCDSTIVIAWIHKESRDLKTFVANRIAKIQELTCAEQWHHILSEQNPADLVSRGMRPAELCNNSLWWYGPEVLFHNEYPRSKVELTNEQSDFLCELKLNNDSKCLSNITVTNFVIECLKLSNNYLTILRILSYMFRFIQNVRNPLNRVQGSLDATELKDAETFLVKKVQEVHFEEEIKCILEGGSISCKSKLLTLNPFLDAKGILRVGGRLSKSDLEFDHKFPIVLPKNHLLTYLVILHYHEKYLHVGASSLLSLVREKFWPLSARSTCRKVVHNCTICFKVKPVISSQLMGDLPRDRVTPDYPFNCAGVDFCGPFYIKYKNQRKGILHKIYVCLFVCFSTKAIHLEIVSDLTSAAFIACLKRFISRRGKCAKVYSDNAKNFVGANREIKRLTEIITKPDEILSKYLSGEGIEWKFIPPRSPNFGGLWEAAIKSFKYHFFRIVRGANLNYEEFLTVIVQVEGILNSRPLCPLSANEDDFSVLTPAHFLINRSLNSINEPDLTNLRENILKKWQKVTKLVQLIWKKWHRKYLSELQQRSKWRFEKDNVNVGDLVLLVEENLPTYKWPLGRIIDVYYGDDKKIRVVKIKTESGTFKRAISKICILPMPTM